MIPNRFKMLPCLATYCQRQPARQNGRQTQSRRRQADVGREIRAFRHTESQTD